MQFSAVRRQHIAHSKPQSAASRHFVSLKPQTAPIRAAFPQSPSTKKPQKPSFIAPILRDKYIRFALPVVLPLLAAYGGGTVMATGWAYLLGVLAFAGAAWNALHPKSFYHTLSWAGSFFQEGSFALVPWKHEVPDFNKARPKRRGKLLQSLAVTTKIALVAGAGGFDTVQYLTPSGIPNPPAKTVVFKPIEQSLEFDWLNPTNR